MKLWPPIGDANIALPCGKCVGCRTDRATRWATRCIHEASIWKHNCCLTLTYADENLPADNALTPRDLTLFVKRLRRYADRSSSTLNRDRGYSIRYLACGEYGTLFGRPHYHVLLFNAGFSDLRPRGKYFTSQTLRELWPHGSNTIDPGITGRSAAYVAQYTLAKQRMEAYIDADGVLKQPPFLRMSLKPAIGASWLAKYPTDLQKGFLVENGRKQAIPRYYRTKLKELYPELEERIQDAMATARLRMSQLHSDIKDPDRLLDAETIHKRRKKLSEGPSKARNSFL